MKITFTDVLKSLFGDDNSNSQPDQTQTNTPTISSLKQTINPSGQITTQVGNPQPLKITAVPSGATAQQAQHYISQQNLILNAISGGTRVADTPFEEEDSILAYPTKHSLEPTKLNKGIPWAGQKVPKGYIDGVAKAKVLAESMPEFFTQKDAEELLPLSLRESVYHGQIAYGNNGVWVNYKTPPPKELNSLIAKAESLKKQELNVLGDKAKELERQRQLIEEEILRNPHWKSRAESYHKTTDIITKRLGLNKGTPSETQEIVYNEKTGDFIGKADVYRPELDDSYETKAKFILAHFANKRFNENRSGPSSRTYIGGGKAADIRYDQQLEIDNAIDHDKNKPLKDYHDARYKYYKNKPN